MDKIQYYDISNIASVQAQYRMILGKRSNGKSYAVKYRCLCDAWEGRLLIYLRRWQTDIKGDMVEMYFGDMSKAISKLTKAQCNCITVYRGTIYFARRDKNDNVERLKVCGRAMYLGGAEHYKSMALPDYDNIILEECVTNEGYQNDEVRKLMSIVSTVGRNRNINVWMIGNTVSRMCPYVREWDLHKVAKQEPGTIDIYNVAGDGYTTTIAVEVTSPTTGSKSSMIVGHHSAMINSGAWESDVQPKLPGDYRNDYNVLYSVLWHTYHTDYRMDLLRHKQSGAYTLYVYPHLSYEQRQDGAPITRRYDTPGGRRDISRIITSDYDTDPLHTPKLRDDIRGDVIITRLLQLGKICYSDDLTGTEFAQILNGKGGD